MVLGSDRTIGGKVYIFAMVDGEWSEITNIQSPVISFGHEVLLSGNMTIIASMENVLSYSLDECW